jgi:hypothetical protein
VIIENRPAFAVRGKAEITQRIDKKAADHFERMATNIAFIE